MALGHHRICSIELFRPHTVSVTAVLVDLIKLQSLNYNFPGHCRLAILGGGLA